MCYTLQSKIIFSLLLSNTMCVCVFFCFLYISFFSSIYAKLKASLFVLCVFFLFYYQFWILFCSALSSILYYISIRMWYRHFVCILCILYFDVTLSNCLKRCAFFSFLSYFLYYLFVFHVRFLFCSHFFSSFFVVVVVVHFFPL